MGQGSYHGIATLVLEELGARWDQTDVVGGWGNPKLYGNLASGGVFQVTGGSSSMASSWDRYRIAGAAAREMLVAAAAEQWGVPAGGDLGGRGEGDPSDRRQPQLRRARRAGCGDAGAGPAEPQAARAVDADRERRRPPLRQPAEDQRHASVHQRRDPSRHADRHHDPSAEVRRDRQVVRRRGGEGDARHRRRGGNAARPRRDRREHVGGDPGARGGHCGVGRGRGRDPRLGRDPRGLPRARRRQAAGRRGARGRRRHGDGRRGAGARGALRVPLPRPCGARAAERGGADERGRRARGLGRAPGARLLPGRRRPGRRRDARQGAAARHEDRRRLRPARGASTPTSSSRWSPRRGRSAGARRSRCSGRARTT